MQAASAPPEPPQKQLCDAACTEQLEASTEMVTLPSGLQYRDIVVGKGPKPQVGYQVGQGKRLAGLHPSSWDEGGRRLQYWKTCCKSAVQMLGRKFSQSCVLWCQAHGAIHPHTRVTLSHFHNCRSWPTTSP